MDTWTRITTSLVVATTALTTAHIGDELWARWDYGATPGLNALTAVLPLVGLVTLALITLIGVVAESRWGYWSALALGIVSLWSPLSHVLAPDLMTTYRWAVVLTNIVLLLGLVAAATRELIVVAPLHRGRRVGG